MFCIYLSSLIKIRISQCAQYKIAIIVVYTWLSWKLPACRCIIRYSIAAMKICDKALFFIIKTTSCSLINQVYHEQEALSIPYFNYFSIIFFNSVNSSLPQIGQVESRSTTYFSSTIKPQFGHLIGAYFRGCSVRLRRFLSAMLN